MIIRKSFYIILLMCMLLFACKEDKGIKKQLPPKLELPTVQKIENPSQVYSQTPRLFSNGRALYFSWITQKDSLDHLNYSILKNNKWFPVTKVLSGDDWFTNWADFPAIAESNGNILTSFLQKSANGTYTYDVKLNLFNYLNDTMITNFILHDDNTKSEHGFVSIVPQKEGSFFVTWLDGRNTVFKEKQVHSDHHHGGNGAMTLRGAFINEKGEKINDVELDHKICDCCQTSAANTTNGPVVVYRDRSNDEIRDISIVRSVNGIWTTPQTIGNDQWKIAGCPVNGPSVAAIENNLAVAWYTAVNDIPKVQVAFSQDGGATFGKPYTINTKETLGRVAIVMNDFNEAIVSWMEQEDTEAQVQLLKITHEGKATTPITVMKTSAERASGFPQIALVNNTVYVATTIVDENRMPIIEMAKINVNSL